MKNTENNKLLADFMCFITIDQRKRNDQRYFTSTPFVGDAIVEYDHTPYPSACRKEDFCCSEMLFDTSWDWSMSVVEKIESMVSTFNIDTTIYENRDTDYVVNCSYIDRTVSHTSKIEAVYNTCIKYYNYTNCKHENILREDSCDECLDCGVKNY